jgi:hypothetical protein
MPRSAPFARQEAEWNGGPQGSHALAASGGTSGIIMDNVVGSGVLAGTSEVYFSPLSTGACGAGNGCAVQASHPCLRVVLAETGRGS